MGASQTKMKRVVRKDRTSKNLRRISEVTTLVWFQYQRERDRDRIREREELYKGSIKAKMFQNQGQVIITDLGKSETAKEDWKRKPSLVIAYANRRKPKANRKSWKNGVRERKHITHPRQRKWPQQTNEVTPVDCFPQSSSAVTGGRCLTVELCDTDMVLLCGKSWGTQCKKSCPPPGSVERRPWGGTATSSEWVTAGLWQTEGTI